MAACHAPRRTCRAAPGDRPVRPESLTTSADRLSAPPGDLGQRSGRDPAARPAVSVGAGPGAPAGRAGPARQERPARQAGAAGRRRLRLLPFGLGGFPVGDRPLPLDPRLAPGPLGTLPDRRAAQVAGRGAHLDSRGADLDSLGAALTGRRARPGRRDAALSGPRARPGRQGAALRGHGAGLGGRGPDLVSRGAGLGRCGADGQRRLEAGAAGVTLECGRRGDHGRLRRHGGIPVLAVSSGARTRLRRPGIPVRARPGERRGSAVTAGIAAHPARRHHRGRRIRARRHHCGSVSRAAAIIGTGGSGAAAIIEPRIPARRHHRDRGVRARRHHRGAIRARRHHRDRGVRARRHHRAGVSRPAAIIAAGGSRLPVAVAPAAVRGAVTGPVSVAAAVAVVADRPAAGRSLTASWVACRIRHCLSPIRSACPGTREISRAPMVPVSREGPWLSLRPVASQVTTLRGGTTAVRHSADLRMDPPAPIQRRGRTRPRARRRRVAWRAVRTGYPSGSGRCPQCLLSRGGRPRVLPGPQTISRPTAEPGRPAGMTACWPRAPRTSDRTSCSSMSCTSGTWPTRHRWTRPGGISSPTTSRSRPDLSAR